MLFLCHQTELQKQQQNKICLLSVIDLTSDHPKLTSLLKPVLLVEIQKRAGLCLDSATVLAIFREINYKWLNLVHASCIIGLTWCN